ncbi:AbgT family transporter [Silanimonas sp.]|uniref:AbgT family transporter n=1 Tax=Silanimonas sp. TaxID=1929290 RepID=UPI0022BF22F6|nr:AbgT family transporter [Silanimonas sp.]MCZ8061745.1 AbgT family transporter [Silanimonas sp.]
MNTLDASPGTRRRGVLDWIEWLGNKLPEPALLFALLAFLVVLLSALGSALEWQVQPVKPVLETQAVVQADGSTLQQPVLDANGRPVLDLVASGTPIQPRSLLTADGIYWMLSSALRNFAQMPAMPLIFVAMLGIGLAEKFGFFSALMRSLALLTPKRLLTPAVVMLGATASVASDAGYIILPPLAAALYLAVGRHPVAGMAAAFAGVAGGFGAGFFPNGSDGVLTGFAQDAARVIDPDYSVSILHNYFFKVASVFTVMAAGWFVTDVIVEPRLERQHPGDKVGAADDTAASMALSPKERRGLKMALAAVVVGLGLLATAVLVPGMPLHGDGKPTLPNGRALTQTAVQVLPAGADAPTDAVVLATEPLTVIAEGAPRLVESPGPRWSHVIVPVIVILFLLPGLAYGVATGTLRGQQDLADALNHGIRSIVPVLVMLFFLAQFVAYMGYSGLDRMLAYAGGSVLFNADLPIPLLVVAFVLVVVFGDFAMSGMLSKFGVLAPIFIPMFMIVGMSPELTTAAYRIGDSVVNIVTPLNSYLLIILAVFQKYRPKAGLGTLIALMVPYSIVIGLVWTAMLVAWVLIGAPLGPESPLYYVPGG